MDEYCAFSKDHKCLKWEDYELTRHELEEADKQLLRCLTFAGQMMTKDSPGLCKGQIMDKSCIRVKKELLNDEISSFRSHMCSDPYGN